MNTRDVPNCADFAGKVGDKGQRYEIRFFQAIYEETDHPGVEIKKRGEEKVFGWAEKYPGAKQMRDACALAPWAMDPFIVDRKAFTVGELARALQELPEQGARVVVDSTYDPGDSEYPYSNVTSVRRLDDGRVVID